jgi:plastocyanin
MKMATVIRGALCLSVLVCGSYASAADWGSIKGKFVVDGSVGDPTAINVNKDQETCGKHNLVDETVVVGDGGALQNAVVFIYTRKALEVHPDYGDAKEATPAVLDNKGCRFEPHIQAVRTGQNLQIGNSDPVGHNTNAAFVQNPAFNQMITSGTPVSITLTKPEPVPATVACNIHPWMKGYLVVREDPYVGISNDKGEFEIKNIPVGQHEFVFWHEGKGNMRDLALKGGKTDRRGRAKLKIVANETLDLGEIKVPAAALGAKVAL